MKNADLFKNTFGMYATEIWSMPEKDFLKWLNEDAKQKTGKWIYKLMEGTFCSECDEPSVWKFNYCPNCGAKMEVEHEDR